MSVQEHQHLPPAWNELWQAHEQVPWQALQQLAEAAAADDRIVDDLFRAFHDQSPDDPRSLYFSQLYVSVIFALAAPRLSDPARARVAQFLLEELISAGEDEDDFREDVLLAAAGTLGPEAVLPAILKLMPEDFSPPETVWGLWHLASLADKTFDAVLRERIIALAEKAVRRADAGLVEVNEIGEAVWTLAMLDKGTARPLLQRLYDKTQSLEIEECLELVDGKIEPEELYQPWKQPVQEWATQSWQWLKGWRISGPDARPGDDESEVADRRAIRLAGEFEVSSEGQALPVEIREYAHSIVYDLLSYAWNYAGAGPEDLSEAALKEVLLELFPGKVTAEPSFFAAAGPVTEAFLGWLQNKGMLADAKGLQAAVASWRQQIVDLADDPQNWHIAKSMAMDALAHGVDPRDEEAMGRSIEDYNRRVFQQPEIAADDDLRLPASPIVNEQPKVGRNDPCPCGSGKKYKKCCGRGA